MAKFYILFVTLCLVQLCLSAPAAESNVETTSESAPVKTTTLATSKSIENLTNEELLGLIKEWGEELKKPNITDTEKEDFMMAIIGASFLMASRAGQFEFGSPSSEESKDNAPTLTTTTAQNVN